MKLTKAIQALSLQDKEELLNHLVELIKREKMGNNIDSLKMMVCDEMCIPSYNPKSRERNNVIVGIITANILLRRGHSETHVGKALEKDHSTIHHYKKVLDTWLDYPGFYKQELSVWNKINKRYETD